MLHCMNNQQKPVDKSAFAATSQNFFWIECNLSDHEHSLYIACIRQHWQPMLTYKSDES